MTKPIRRVAVIGAGVMGSGIAAHFETERALTSAGQHLVGREFTADAGGQAQPLQPRCRQHDGVVLAFVELAQPGADIAAQLLDLQVRPQLAQLGLTAQRCGADHRAVNTRVVDPDAGGREIGRAANDDPLGERDQFRRNRLGQRQRGPRARARARTRPARPASAGRAWGLPQTATEP